MTLLAHEGVATAGEFSFCRVRYRTHPGDGETHPPVSRIDPPPPCRPRKFSGPMWNRMPDGAPGDAARGGSMPGKPKKSRSTKRPTRSRSLRLVAERRVRRDAETAHHEAGHFIASHHLTPSADVYSLTIEQDNDTLGEVGGEDPFSDAKTRKDAERCIVVLYAGFAAQVRFFPRSAKRARANAADDDEKAERLLAILEPNAKRRQGLEEGLRRQAANFVADHWDEVVAVAEDLLERGTVPGEEAELLLQALAGDSEARTVLATLRDARWNS